MRKLFAMTEAATRTVFSPLKVLFNRIAEAGDFPLRQAVRDGLSPVEADKPSYRELVEGVQARTDIRDIPKIEGNRLRIGDHVPVPVKDIDSVVFYSSPDGGVDVLLTEGGNEKPLSTVYSGTIDKDHVDLIPEFQDVLTSYDIASTDLAVYSKRLLTPVL